MARKAPSSPTDAAAVDPSRKPRSGRPPNSMAGKVEERIVDAAKRVFLECGYEGASLDEIATAAHASKATLYNRYAGKEALFKAVMARTIDRVLTLDQAVLGDAPVEHRLNAAGVAVLDRMLTPEVISMMRVVMAEAPRFPTLAKLAHELGRERAIRTMAEILTDQPLDDLPGTVDAANRRVNAAAEFFLDLALLPLQHRALLGYDLVALRAQIPAQVARAAALAVAASRS